MKLATKLTVSLAGITLTAAGTLLHPMSAPPNDAALAFAEYAADQTWLMSHLMQLAGVAAMISVVALIAFDGGWKTAKSLALASGCFAVAGLAIAAALQAVDGIALKAMVDSWQAVTPDKKDAAFAAALAVRQIEIGFAAMLSLVLGVATVLFGLAQMLDGRFKPWLGYLGGATGIGLLGGGLAMAVGGFSDLAMTVNTAGLALTILWMPLTARAADRTNDA